MRTREWRALSQLRNPISDKDDIATIYALFKSAENVLKKRIAGLRKEHGALWKKSLISNIEKYLSVLIFLKSKTIKNWPVYQLNWQKKPTDVVWSNQGYV